LLNAYFFEHNLIYDKVTFYPDFFVG